MKSHLVIFVLLLCTACQQNTTEQKRVEALISNLAAAKEEILDLKKEEKCALTHLVYLDLKEDISQTDKNKLVAAIYKLEEIPVVKNLSVGTFKNLNDPRALSDYELIFQMDFKEVADYDIYQAHVIHQALKEVAKELLVGAPVTYDFEGGR